MKMNFKKSIALGLIIVITHETFYALGSMVNRKQMLSLIAQDFNTSNASVNLGRYIEYRDVVVAIKAGKPDRAICISELGASSMYDDLKSCLADQGCSTALEEKIRKAAPEVLGEEPLKFSYIESKDKIRSCVQKN